MGEVWEGPECSSLCLRGVGDVSLSWCECAPQSGSSLNPVLLGISGGFITQTQSVISSIFHSSPFSREWVRAENSKMDYRLVFPVLMWEPSGNPLRVTSIEEKTIAPGGSVRKNLPAMWETCVQSLGLEDPLEEEMATHSRILAWRIPWTEEPGRLHSPWGPKVLDMAEWLSMHAGNYEGFRSSVSGTEYISHCLTTSMIKAHSLINCMFQKSLYHEQFFPY